MDKPEIMIGMVANLWTRQMTFKKKGDIELGHKHQFDHLTLLASGSLKVEIEGNITEFKAPFMIFISKDKRHELTALEDNTIAYCIHALRDIETGDILDHSMFPNGVIPTDACQDLCVEVN